jgi:hypothetical protein
VWRDSRGFDEKEEIMGGTPWLLTTPVSALQDWLLTNTDKLRFSPERDIILLARLEVPQIAQMDNGDIAWEIHKWAEKHSFMPVNLDGSPSFTVSGDPGAAPVRAGDPAILDSLKGASKTIQSITDLKWVGDGASAGISVSGASVSKGQGNTKMQLTAGWDRTLELKTDLSGMTFSAKMDPVNQNWTMTFTIGRQAPNLSDVANVFQQGESAIRGVLSNVGKVDLSNPGNTAQQFAPYLSPIKQAVDAASKIAAQRPGDISFGVSLKGGLPGAPASAGGVTVTGVLTVVF